MYANLLRRLRPQPWMIHAAGGAVIAAAGLAFYGWYLAPTSADMDQRLKRMEQLQALMASKEKIADEHRRLDQRLGELRKAAASTKKRMPRRTASQEFIRQATQLAETLDLKMELCTAAAAQTFPTHSQVEVTCRFNGSYDSTCQYLAAIDQFTQISKVSHLEVDTSVISGKYPVNVTFQLYYRGEDNDTQVKRGAL
jgi:Tfp pilus assembly protein PilO